MPLMVIKSNNTREPFDADKLRSGLLKACERRPIPIDTIDKIIAEVEYAVQSYVMEVSTRIIGEQVMARLKKIDAVSYLRFASVFQDFTSVDDFMASAAELRNEQMRSAKGKRTQKTEVGDANKREGDVAGSGDADA